MGFSAYKNSLKVARLAAGLLKPNLELIIYNYQEKHIELVEESLSGFKVGDKLGYIDTAIDKARQALSSDNQESKPELIASLLMNFKFESFSQIIEAEKFKIMLCVLDEEYALVYHLQTRNYDQALQNMELALQALTGRLAADEQISSLNAASVESQVHEFIAQYKLENKIQTSKIPKQDRIKIIHKLDEQDVFKFRNAVNIAAKAINISQASVYNYLKMKQD